MKNYSHAVQFAFILSNAKSFEICEFISLLNITMFLQTPFIKSRHITSYTLSRIGILIRNQNFCQNCCQKLFYKQNQNLLLLYWERLLYLALNNFRHLSPIELIWFNAWTRILLDAETVSVLLLPKMKYDPY